MKKKTKMMYMLNKLRCEIMRNLPFTKSAEEMCETIEYMTETLRNSIIVDKNALDLRYEADYGLSNKNRPLIKKAQLISKKAYFFNENNESFLLAKGAQEGIKEDLLEAIEERVDEDESN